MTAKKKSAPPKRPRHASSTSGSTKPKTPPPSGSSGTGLPAKYLEAERRCLETHKRADVYFKGLTPKDFGRLGPMVTAPDSALEMTTLEGQPLMTFPGMSTIDPDVSDLSSLARRFQERAFANPESPWVVATAHILGATVRALMRSPTTNQEALEELHGPAAKQLRPDYKNGSGSPAYIPVRDRRGQLTSSLAPAFDAISDLLQTCIAAARVTDAASLAGFVWPVVDVMRHALPGFKSVTESVDKDYELAQRELGTRALGYLRSFGDEWKKSDARHERHDVEHAANLLAESIIRGEAARSGWSKHDIKARLDQFITERDRKKKGKSTP